MPSSRQLSALLCLFLDFILVRLVTSATVYRCMLTFLYLLLVILFFCTKDCCIESQLDMEANFKAHVDSGWACQALIYLNDDFQGGYTEFPNLKARYRPRRGRVLLWRSVCVGFKAAIPGSLDDHPARHVACEVFNGVKRVVSLHLVLA